MELQQDDENPSRMARVASDRDSAAIRVSGSVYWYLLFPPKFPGHC
jgi:hypothetical protein